MIDELLSRLGNEGLASPARFVVEFTRIPSAMQSIAGISTLQEGMRFYAESAEIPGTQMTTQDVRYYDMPAKFAYGKLVDDLNVTFRLDAKYGAKKFLDAWTNSIYNAETGNLSYKTDYAGTIQISQIAPNGEVFYSVEFEDAFPYQIQPIQLGWDQKGAYQRVTTIFSYRRWAVKVRSAVFSASAARNIPERTSNVLSQIGSLPFDAENVRGQVMGGVNSLLNGRDFSEVSNGAVNRVVSRITPSIMGSILTGFN